MSMDTQITAIEDLRKNAWEELREKVNNCQKCPLHQKRKHTVFGEGPTRTCRCVLIGEAPGEEEDEKGRPFVGRSGILLTKIFTECGIPRDTVYITNILKCRPPDNRDPQIAEMDACEEYLNAQLVLLHPDIVVTVGKVSTQRLCNTTQNITSMHGRWFDWRRIMLFPIFHPSYLLRNERNTSPNSPINLTYRDAQKLKAVLDRLRFIPQRRSTF